jgi:hypothetical protein
LFAPLKLCGIKKQGNMVFYIRLCYNANGTFPRIKGRLIMSKGCPQCNSQGIEVFHESGNE